MLLIPTFLCPKPWEAMTGNEAQRFCTYCRKHVHNLAALTAAERLALLTSPAASLCSRYRVAIRRPVKGKEKPYLRHLLKYGAGVAVTGSVLLVLWEMQTQAEQKKYYRLAGGIHSAMPGHLYTEHPVMLLGEMVLPTNRAPHPKSAPAKAPTPADQIDLDLDSAAIDQLIDQCGPPDVTTNPVLPLE